MQQGLINLMDPLAVFFTTSNTPSKEFARKPQGTWS
jgi:hypothetical protein